MDSDGRRDNLLLPGLVALTLFGAYVAAQRGGFPSYDGGLMSDVAKRLVTHHTVSIDPRVDTLRLQNGYSWYALGTSLIELPLTVVQQWFAPTKLTWVSLTNPLVLAACGALIVRIGRLLGWRWVVCVLAGLGFGLLTPAVWESTEGFSEPGTTLGLLLALVGILYWQRGYASGPWLASSGVAIAVLFHTDSIFLVAPVLLIAFLTIPRPSLLRSSTIVAFAIPVALLTAIDLWYNQVRFGSMFDTGYAREASKQGFNRPLLSGLDLFLRSPGRGIFWSAPILLAALPGFVFLVRRCRAIGLVLAGLCVLRLLFYARWWAADGGVGWGPRLLFPITALLVIAAGELIEHLWVYASPRRRHAAWVTLGALAAASGFLALLSVFVPYEQWWRESVNRNRAASIPQQTHDYYFSASRNPIVGDLRLMARTRPFPLQHFVGGPSTVGIAAVLIALVSGIAAIVVASRRDSDASRRSIAKGT